MISVFNSVCLSGVNGLMTSVETFVTPGLREFNIIGLAGASVKESKNRVSAAIRNCGYDMPKGRITVNLAPSDVRKEGTAFDLAIAAGLMASGGYLDPAMMNGFALIGELSLDGMVRPVGGVFSMCVLAKKNGVRNIVVPDDNASELTHLEGIRIWPVGKLSDLCEVAKREKTHLEGRLGAFPRQDGPWCMSNIKGHKKAKRAIEIAAAGNHNILLLGAAGSGKTMLAHSVKTILPQLGKEDIYDVTALYSLCGLLNDKYPVVYDAPFREVHTGITKTALIGGGRPVVPGEISLSHRGVLFLDEVTEIDRAAIDSLRQPMDSGEVTVSRVGHIEKLPADFMLVCAMNPCRCGNLLEGPEKCTCTPKMIASTLEKLSKPIIDRIDLHVPVKTPGYNEICADKPESSEEVRKRVEIVRGIQADRLKKKGIGKRFYSRLTGDELSDICEITPGADKLLMQYAEYLSVSIRSFNKIKAVAMTIADLNGHTAVSEGDMAEAVQYRIIDRKLFGEGGYVYNAA